MAYSHSSLAPIDWSTVYSRELFFCHPKCLKRKMNTLKSPLILTNKQGAKLYNHKVYLPMYTSKQSLHSWNPCKHTHAHTRTHPRTLTHTHTKKTHKHSHSLINKVFTLHTTGTQLTGKQTAYLQTLLDQNSQSSHFTARNVNVILIIIMTHSSSYLVHSLSGKAELTSLLLPGSST